MDTWSINFITNLTGLVKKQTFFKQTHNLITNQYIQDLVWCEKKDPATGELCILVWYTWNNLVC
jgi:hypothetical protein